MAIVPMEAGLLRLFHKQSFQTKTNLRKALQGLAVFVAGWYNE
jgi:hypothetical protein